MIYDSARSVTVLFGGMDSTFTLSEDTWEWDGVGWIEQPINGASIRVAPAMAYDPIRAATVLFGATPCCGGEQTWELTCPVPAISIHPASRTVCVGTSASFAVTAHGPGTLTYQWQVEAEPLGSDIWSDLSEGTVWRSGVIVGSGSGTATSEYLFQHAQSNQGLIRFRVVVTTECGRVQSGGATLTLSTSDFDGDGDLGTDADIEAFFSCLGGNCCPLCGSADFDGDGDVGTDSDIEAFFRVLSGGPC
jgi:hypothetical protein